MKREIKCPKCGERIGFLGDRKIRFIVRKLVKNFKNLDQVDVDKMITELDAMEAEEDARDA